jgi:hypothetical protein
LLVARAIHEDNPHHINDRVLRAFHRAIGAEEASSSPIPPTP